jgi:hypothetical protein
MVMNEAIDVCALDGEDVLGVAVSDAALEAAASAGPRGAGAFTVGPCTVMSDCSSGLVFPPPHAGEVASDARR